MKKLKLLLENTSDFIFIIEKVRVFTKVEANIIVLHMEKEIH